MSQEPQHKLMSIIPHIGSSWVEPKSPEPPLYPSVCLRALSLSPLIPSQLNLHSAGRDLRDQLAPCSHLTESRSGLPKVTR